LLEFKNYDDFVNRLLSICGDAGEGSIRAYCYIMRTIKILDLLTNFYKVDWIPDNSVFLPIFKGKIGENRFLE
jgi:hypothetical protein